MRDRMRSRFTFVIPFLPFFVLLVSSSGPVASATRSAPTYTIFDLGTLGGDWSFAQDINARGQVVGGSMAVAGPYRPFHAFLWEAGTGMQDLGTLGGDGSVAYGINAQGQIVGYSTTAADLGHAFLWEAGTGMQDLGTLGGPHSIAYGINERGQVVGWASTTTGAMHAFLWEADTDGLDRILTASGTVA
jgi:probable HAF family extracellular repeat protein